MAEDQGLYEKYGLDVYPKDAVKGMTPEKIIDHSPLKELEDSGFIRDLYLK